MIGNEIYKGYFRFLRVVSANLFAMNGHKR